MKLSEAIFIYRQALITEIKGPVMPDRLPVVVRLIDDIITTTKQHTMREAEDKFASERRNLKSTIDSLKLDNMKKGI